MVFTPSTLSIYPGYGYRPFESSFRGLGQQAQPVAQTEASSVVPVSLPKISVPLSNQGNDFSESAVFSVERAAGFFMLGLAASYGGSAALRKWSGKVANQATKSASRPSGPVTAAESSSGQEAAALPHGESQTFLYFQKPVSSMFMTVLQQPEMARSLGMYAAAAGTGYFASNVLKGAQETWVRRKETAIRASLLNRLKGVFKQSIQTKEGFDRDLKAVAQRRIEALLKRHEIPIPQSKPRFTANRPWMPLNTNAARSVNRRYFYEPTHRQPLAMSASGLSSMYFEGEPLKKLKPLAQSAVGFGNSDVGLPSSVVSKLTSESALDVLFTASGLATGMMLHGAGKMLQGFHQVLSAHESASKQLNEGAKTVTKMVTKTVSLNDTEALAYLKRPSLILAYGALAGVVGAGKLFLDALREVEVTRQNAKTEYGYQAYNWGELDPSFHQIAEEEAVTSALKALEADLPRLRQQPQALRARIDGILSGVGLNSAPKYFPMTPSVGLVNARG